MRYLPTKSIAQIGLRKHLDATKERHNGNGYQEFVAAIETANKQKLADKFNVDYSTMYRWIKAYEKEHKAYGK